MKNTNSIFYPTGYRLLFSIIGIFFSIFCFENAYSQGIYFFKIGIFPDSSKIYLNEKFIGYSPISFSSKINFKEYYQYDLKITHEGYKDKLISYNQLPDEKLVYINENLERINKGTDSLPELRYGFDKMVYDIPDGTKIGEIKYRGVTKTFKWESSEVQGTTGYNKQAEDNLIAFGLNVVKQVKLFSDEQVEKAPDLMLGAELKDILISNKQNIRSIDTFNCHMKIEWQFFSFRQNKVIGSITTDGDFETNSDEINIISSGAFKNAISRLLYGPKFVSLMRDFAMNKSKFSRQVKAIAIKDIKAGKYADNPQMISNVIKSVVTVKAEDELSFGSGFLISDDGYLLTNYHVIANEKSLNVVFDNGFTFPAEIVSFDQEFDVALLKIKGSGFRPVAFGNSDSAMTGADVIAIGTPKDLNLGQTVSKGIISGRRTVEEHTYLQTDVSVNPGNSGGPLINSKGEVIGIVSRKRLDAEGVSFAIPINVVISRLNITMK